MAGISSKAAGKLENRFKYNGNKLESGEFSDGSGLEMYDFNARTYDQQTGRFIQIDPIPDVENQEMFTPYHFTGNNPIRFNDPTGKCGWCTEVWKDIKNASKETWQSIKRGAVDAYNGSVRFATAFNRFNPITNAAEAVSGKSSESGFTESKSRATAIADLGVNTIMLFGPGLAASGRVSIGTEATIASNALKGGEWITTNESMSGAAAEFQSSVTGQSASQSFLLNGVKFDGVAGNTLLEAKSGMANFVNSKTGQFQSWFKGSQGLVDQATRQLEAAGGANVQWVFEKESVMKATQTLFKENGIKGIDLVYKAK